MTSAIGPMSTLVPFPVKEYAQNIADALAQSTSALAKANAAIPLTQKDAASGVAALTTLKRTPYPVGMTANLPTSVRVASAVNAANYPAVLASNVVQVSQHGNNLAGAVVFRAPFRKDSIMRVTISGRSFNSTGEGGLIVNTDVVFYARSALGPQSFQVLHRGTLEPQIRVGYHNSNIVIVMGDVGTLVNHGLYAITHMFMTYTGTTDTDADGWTGSVVTDLTGYDLTSPQNIFSSARTNGGYITGGTVNTTNKALGVTNNGSTSGANSRQSFALAPVMGAAGANPGPRYQLFRSANSGNTMARLRITGASNTARDLLDASLTYYMVSGGTPPTASSLRHSGVYKPAIGIFRQGTDNVIIVDRASAPFAFVMLQEVQLAYPGSTDASTSTWTAEATDTLPTETITWFTDIADAEVTPFKGFMTAAQNLNDYIYRENWQVSTATIANGGTNFPIGQAGTFEVLAQVTRSGPAAGYVAQRYTGGNSNRVFNRTYSGTTWNAWREFAFLDNPVFTGVVQAAGAVSGYAQFGSALTTGGLSFRGVSGTALSFIDFEAGVTTGALESSQLRLFRATTATMEAGLTMYAADASASFAHQLNAKTGTISSLVRLANQQLVVGPGSPNATDKMYVSGPVSVNGPVKPGQYTLTTLPAAASYSGAIINVTNATGGQKLCMSNGTNWQILNTSTTVS